MLCVYQSQTPFTWKLFCMLHLFSMVMVMVIASVQEAHGLVVTSSRQTTEVKQRQARLVLVWVTGARVTLPVMCRGVGKAFHIISPLSTQQWWVPGGTNNGELWMAIAAENALNSSQRRWDHTRESSNTRGVNCEVCWTTWDIRLYTLIQEGPNVLLIHLIPNVKNYNLFWWVSGNPYESVRSSAT